MSVSCAGPSEPWRMPSIYSGIWTSSKNGKEIAWWSSIRKSAKFCMIPARGTLSGKDYPSMRKLEETDGAKYLGVNRHKPLSWNSQIDQVTKKANSTRAFLRRNIFSVQCKPNSCATRLWCNRVCQHYLGPFHSRQYWETGDCRLLCMN